jgi:MFS family permease
VLAAGFLGEFAFALLLLPLVQHYLPVDRHLSLAVPGYVLAAYGAARLLVQMPLGAAADALDDRLAFGLGYLVVLIAGLLFWPPVSVAVLIAAAVAYGVGHALADPLIPAALVADVGAEAHGRVLGLLSLAQVAGLVLGLGGGAFIVDLASPSAGFMIVAAANLLALVLLVVAAGETSHLPAGAAQITEQAGFRKTLLDEPLLYLFAVFFVLALAANLITPDLSPFIVRRLHTSLHVMTLYLIPSGIAGIIALWYGGWLADRFGRLPPLLAGAGVAALAFAVFTHLTNPWQGAVAAIFGAAGLALTLPASTAALLDEASHEHRGLLMAGMMAVQGLAEAIGPFIGGMLIAVGGAAVPFAAAAAACWLAIPLGVLYAGAPRRGQVGTIIGYTPFTRVLSEANLHLHAWYLHHTAIGKRVTGALDSERHGR